MIRNPKSEAAKIAYSILGKPMNIVDFDKHKKSKKDQRLLFEATRLGR